MLFRQTWRCFDSRPLAALFFSRVDTGEWLTRSAVWLALLLYVIAEWVKAARPGGQFDTNTTGRWLNTLGCAAFLAHVAFAFHFYHSWSHWKAYAHTARQTAEWFGWSWGGGLYFNYAFALLWVGEVVWSWASPISHRARSMWMTILVRVFFFFMMFNGAVVFARGAGRWFGLVLCLLLAGAWWPRRKTRGYHTSE